MRKTFLKILLVSVFVTASLAGPLDLHPHRLEKVEQLEDLNYRLPTNTRPLSYKIELTTNIHLPDETSEEKYNFDGKVTIVLTPTVADTNTITLHSRQQTIKTASLYLGETQTEDPIELTDPKGTYNETLEFLTFELSEEGATLTENEKYTLIIEYSAILREDNAGFYRSSYINDEGKKVYLATTQFESTDARHAFPGYDEPGTRAPIQLTINHDKSYHAIANTPGVRVDRANNRVDTVFEETKSMQTYLLAFVVSDFLYTGKVIGALTPQRVFARPEAIKNFEGDFGLDSGIKILTDLEHYLNTSYSLPKLDQISIPDFAAGAMENWGLVTYREELLLYNPKTTSINQKHRIATIISHELAHQFFGNLVSPEWWNYIWLNEGFATLYEYTTTASVYPEFRSMDFMIRDAVQYSLATDALDTTRAMTTDAQSPTQISNLFDDIAYEKSGSVLRMIQHAITDEAFSLGLTIYLDKRKYQAANSDHLAAALEEAAKAKKTEPTGFTITELVDSWSKQEGYPVVYVEKTNTGGVFLKQDRFKYSKPAEGAAEQTWIVPVSFATGTKPDFETTVPKFWLTKNNDTIPESTVKLGDNEWIVVNVQETGFYRVNYANNLWQSITRQLTGNNWNVIHYTNRAQLVDDVLNLARGNVINYDTAFNLLQYLKKEHEFLPWTSANSGFGYLNRVLLDTEPYKFFQRFVREAVTGLYNELGTKDGGLYEPLPQKVARNIAIEWACLTGVETCLKETQQRVQDVIDNPETDIEPDLQLTIFCNGLRKADQKQYDAILDRLKNTESQGTRTTLITSLGCITDATIQEKFLQTSIDTENPVNYRPQERNRVLQAVYLRGGITGLMSSIKFVNEKHVEIDDSYSKSASSSSPARSATSAMADRVTTEAAQTEYEKLLNTLVTADKLTPVQRTNLLSTTQANLDWVKGNGEEILNYFKRLYGAASVPVVSTVSLVVLVCITYLFNY